MKTSIKNILSRFAALFLLLTFSAKHMSAQEKFFTRTGKISFYSKTNVENIEAHNKTVTAVLDSKTGAVQFSVLMKGFEFPKALMQEHFNENYVESDKFPKSDFKGTVTNNSEVNYKKDGSYPAKVKGALTIHGQTKDIETTGMVTIKEGKIALGAGFNLLIDDYNIKVPSLVRDNISKTISVQVNCPLQPLNN